MPAEDLLAFFKSTGWHVHVKFWSPHRAQIAAHCCREGRCASGVSIWGMYQADPSTSTVALPPTPPPLPGACWRCLCSATCHHLWTRSNHVLPLSILVLSGLSIHLWKAPPSDSIEGVTFSPHSLELHRQYHGAVKCCRVSKLCKVDARAIV